MKVYFLEIHNSKRLMITPWNELAIIIRESGSLSFVKFYADFL